MIVSTGTGLLSWVTNLFKSPDYRLAIDLAKGRLYTECPEVHAIVCRIEFINKTVVFVPGTLKDSVLAQTSVTEDGAVITVDVSKVYRAHDNLMPVLAHEIYHARDCFLITGLPGFCEKVVRDKDLPWHERELEQMAMNAEDNIRTKLIAKGYTMANTRVGAQWQAERLGFKG
jgi:hypothetical protein